MKKPTNSYLRRQLATVATLRQYLYEVTGCEGHEAIYARMLELELRMPRPRRSVVHKLFTLRWAAAKARAWAEMEQRL